jgi:hypothetical protein
VSAERAQNSLQRGLHHNRQTRQALFNQAWGLNRALNNESRQKWLAHATVDVLKRSQEGKITTEEAGSILSSLKEEMGRDEVVISKNFAYITFLLINGERADQYFSQVDYYLEKNKSIWYHLCQILFEKLDVVEDNKGLEKWQQLTGNMGE